MFTHFQNHPQALKTCFATEMWERYGFYVVQSLLALYLAFHFHWPDGQIYQLVSAFTGLTYLSPMIGGWLADHWLGQKRAVLLGALFLLFSYSALALMQSDALLHYALASVALGTGLLKPSISSLLGHAYTEHAPERESGFTIFYMGITTGIILGTTLPSYLQQHLGWSTAFASAALGIVFSAYVFYHGVRRYQIENCQKIDHYPARVLPPILCLCALWVLCILALSSPWIGNMVFGAVLLASIGLIAHTYHREQGLQAKQTLIIGLLCLISVIYWAFYFQMFTSLTLLITRVVQPNLGSLKFPAPYYVCIESLAMLIFGYFMAKSAQRLTKPQLAIQTSFKFLSAVILIGLAYLCIVLCLLWTSESELIHPLYIAPAYLLIALSELRLSPVGLSMVTVLADRKRVSTLMGVFFVSLSLGGYGSGLLANLTQMDPHGADVGVLKQNYLHGLSIMLMLLCIAALACYGLHRVILRIMHDQQEEDPSMP